MLERIQAAKSRQSTLLPASSWPPLGTEKNPSHHWILDVDQQLAASEEQAGDYALSSRCTVNIKTCLTQTHGWSMPSFSGSSSICVTAL